MSNFRGNWWMGLLIILLGVGFLLGNFGFLEFNMSHIVRTYWPVILLVLGINYLQGGKERRNYISGFIFIVLGLLFLGRNTGILAFDMRTFWQMFWPVVLILLGLSFMRGPQIKGRSNWAVMGGVDRTNEAWELESGSYWAFMGGVDLDLRRAVIGEGDYYLNCNAVMGGVDITVPPDLTVNCEGTAVLGGIEFLGKGNGGIFASVVAKQPGATGDDGTVVHIYGRVFMGGIDVNVKER